MRLQLLKFLYGAHPKTGFHKNSGSFYRFGEINEDWTHNIIN